MAEKRDLAAEYTSPQQQLPQQQQLYQQPLLSNQQPMVIQIRRSPAKRYDKFQASRSRVFGICQIVGGVLAIVLNAVGWGLQDSAKTTLYQEHNDYDANGYGQYYWEESNGYYSSVGFWCSLFFFISGAFAISAAKRPTKCLIVTCLVMSIISSVMAVTLFSIATWIMADDARRLSDDFTFTIHFDGVYNNGTYVPHDPESIQLYSNKGWKWAKGVMPVSVLFFFVGVLEVIATIWASVICCQVLCCTEQEEGQYSGVQFLSSPGQSQILVLDRHGRPIRDAQVIQIPTTSQGAAIQPATGQPAQLAVQVAQQGVQMVQTASLTDQPTGQVALTAGQVSQPGPAAQPGRGQVVPPSYTPQLGDGNEPVSQTGGDSPPPPYQ